MRLFTGLDVPYEMRRNLELLLQLLKPRADIAWSSLANMHVTTRFIGEWPEARLPELRDALSRVPRPGILNIAIRGLGWFPNPHSPRVFFAGLVVPQSLHELARATEKACVALGLAADPKPYSPHMTLARIKRPTNLFPLQQAIAGLPDTDFGAFEATHFHLYLSELKPGGSVYTKLASYPLSAS